MPVLDGESATLRLIPSENLLQPSKLLCYCEWPLKTPSATHVLIPLIVSGRPVQECHMGFVHGAPRSKRVCPIATLLTLLEPSETDLLRNPQEDHQGKAGNEDIPPATQRAREDPAGVCIQGSTEQRLTLSSFSRPLKRRHSWLPEILIGIQMGIAETLGATLSQRFGYA